MAYNRGIGHQPYSVVGLSVGPDTHTVVKEGGVKVDDESFKGDKLFVGHALYSATKP